MSNYWDEAKTKEVDGNASDGYHTFDELYEHRTALFIALMYAYPHLSWWSKLHDDGGYPNGYVLCGMDLPTGQVTYHVKEDYIPSLCGIYHYVLSPKYDDHTSEDVVSRLLDWVVTEDD
jgi:hypothetical protein